MKVLVWQCLRKAKLRRRKVNRKVLVWQCLRKAKLRRRKVNYALVIACDSVASACLKQRTCTVLLQDVLACLL